MAIFLETQERSLIREGARKFFSPSSASESFEEKISNFKAFVEEGFNTGVIVEKRSRGGKTFLEVTPIGKPSVFRVTLCSEGG